MTAKILEGNVLETLKDLPACSVQCVVTSPPYYGLRDYGTAKWEGGNPECQHLDEYAKAEQERNRKGLARNANESDGGSRLTIVQNGIDKEFQYKDVCKQCGAKRIDIQIGLEASPELYVENIVAVFREVWRVLKDDGVLWLNLGDSYWGGKGQSSQAWSTEHQDRNTLQKAQHQITGKGETRPTDGKHPVIKAKDLIGIPWMVAFALRADGWYLRSDIIWAKPNPMPESVKDRPTKSHEYIFLLTKSPDYFYDYEAILETAVNRPTDSWDKRKSAGAGSGSMDNGHNSSLAKGKGFSHTLGGYGVPKNLQPDGQQPNSIHVKRLTGESDENYQMRNKRDVWTVNTKPYKGAHFATFPTELIEPCILAGSKEDDTVLDPFNGSGTTGEVSIKHHRLYIGCELNPKYVKLTHRRLSQVQPVLMLEQSLSKREPDRSSVQPTLLTEPKNHCVPVNGVHAPFCTGHKSQSG